ncbi:MAG: helix-turn-helix domain-containing protein, partial [Patescibacteria group bacterium]
QVVLPSDKPPSEISKLEERLKSRFEAGLIVDISPPNFELRCAILQIKSKEKGIELTMDVVGLIAGNMDAARKMEGFLVKLVSEARLKKIAITEDLVKSLIGKGEETNNLKSKAAPPDVISAVSKYYSLNKRVLLGESRTKTIALPRQILMYLLRLELGLPLEEVGRLIGRDHSTVIHAVDKITSLASLDVNVREDILRIKNAFWG